MRSKKIFSALALALILLAGCTKDDVANPSEPVGVNPDGTLKVQDGSGAFYSLQSQNFETNSGSEFEVNQFAYAWLGSFPSLLDGGVIKVNDHELANLANHYIASAMPGYGDTLFDLPTGYSAWNIQGNASSGVQAFNHEDKEAFPPAPSFTVPALININSNLTITHAATGGNVGVLYTLSGDYGDTTKLVPNTSSSMTFTNAEIRSVAESNSQVVVSVMAVSYTTATYSGKKYYFVKQQQSTRQTETL